MAAPRRVLEHLAAEGAIPARLPIVFYRAPAAVEKSDAERGALRDAPAVTLSVATPS
jgi:hypothetical protein